MSKGTSPVEQGQSLDTGSLLLLPRNEAEGGDIADAEVTGMWRLRVASLKRKSVSFKNMDKTHLFLNPHVGFKAYK